MNHHGHIISLEGPNVTFDQLGDHYKKHTLITKTGIEKINQNIQKGTEKERKQVELAVKNLEDKVQTILQQKENKETQTKVQESSKEKQRVMMLAGKKFFAMREKIYSDRSLSTQQKREKEQELYETIQNKFLSEEEKQFFKNMMKNNMMVLIHPNQLKESSVAKQLLIE
jgi:3-dehydroquinate dehydratase